MAGGPRHGDRIGQVVLALRVVAADAVQQAEQPRAVERHQPRIAQGHRALLLRRVQVFDDRVQPAVGAQDKPAIGAGHGWTHPEHDHGRIGSLPPRLDHGAQRLGGHQRRIAIGDQNVALEAFEKRAGSHHGIARTALVLLDDGRVGCDLHRDGLHAGADHRDDLLRRQQGCSRHDMGDHGAARHLVQHLRLIRLHAGALARRQNNAGERTAGFGMMRQCHGAAIV